MPDEICDFDLITRRWLWLGFNRSGIGPGFELLVEVHVRDT